MATTNDIASNGRKRSRREPRRDAEGKFMAGECGNPEGRPLGSRNRARILVETLLDGRAEALAAKAVKMALAGDVLAMRLCLDRLAPARREREMTLPMPAPANAEQLTAAFARVAQAITNGELTPSETNAVSGLLEAARRAIETHDIARRVEEIEERLEEGSDASQGEA